MAPSNDGVVHVQEGAYVPLSPEPASSSVDNAPTVRISLDQDQNQGTPLQSSFLDPLRNALDRFFELGKHHSSVGKECRAGVVLFGAMAYIIAVNGEILAAASGGRGRNTIGMHRTLSATASQSGTALSCGVGTLLVGLVTNRPLGVGPGMGLNTLLAFDLLTRKGLYVEEALGVCLCAAVCLALLALVGVARGIRNVPLCIRKGVVLGIALFQARVGFEALGVTGAGLAAEGPSGSARPLMDASLPPEAGLSLLGCTALLVLLGVPGAYLIGIAAGVVLAAILRTDISTLPRPSLQFPQLQFSPVHLPVLDGSPRSLQISALSGALAVLTVTLVDVGGVLMSLEGQLAEEKKKAREDDTMQSRAFSSGGSSPRSQDIAADESEIQAERAIGRGVLWCVACSSILSALMSTSPSVVFVESAVAIRQGGKTGLTAAVAGGLFLLSLPSLSLLSYVTPAAVAPVLILLGGSMMSAAEGVNWERTNEAIPAFLIAAICGFTGSLSIAVGVGVIFYIALNLPFALARCYNLTAIEQVLGREISAADRERRAQHMEERAERKRQDMSPYGPRRFFIPR